MDQRDLTNVETGNAAEVHCYTRSPANAKCVSYNFSLNLCCTSGCALKRQTLVITRFGFQVYGSDDA
jgi:hypothetical protein